MINEKFIILAALINIAGGIHYIVDTIRGRAIPNRVTWFLWSLAPMLTFAAQIKQHVGWSALFTFTTFTIPIVTFLACFVNKKSYWKISKLDIFCASLSALGLILWQLTKVGNIAILFGILADFAAAVPTLIKSYKDPESESWVGFGSGFLAAFITLLTIKTHSFQASAFALYFVMITATLVYLIRFRKRTA